MRKFTQWKTILGKTDTFEGWRNGDTSWYMLSLQYPRNAIDTWEMYGSKISLKPKDEIKEHSNNVTYNLMSEDQMGKLSTGDYKNNFVVIEITVFNAKPGVTYTEGGDDYTELQLAQHIVEDIWQIDDPRNAIDTWEMYGSKISLKPKDEIKEHFITIFGEMVFNAINDGKMKLLINSSSEMSGRSLIEFILYVLEYVGIKKEYVSVMLNNSVKVDNSQVISWDYFLMEFDQDLKQILQYAYSSFPFDDQQIEYLSTYKKSKRYLCYNANLHAHRLFILNCIFIKKLEGFGLISALNRGEDSLEALQHYYDDHMFDCLETYYSLESVRESDHPLNPVYSFIPTLFDKLPLILDIDNEYLLKENFDIISKMKETYPNLPLEIDNRKFSFRTDRYIHTEHFTDTYFSLVTETTVEHYKWGIDNVVRLTEKIYKAVALHPFIVIGNKNTLKYLRSIGFETFPEMFDESYDDIDDPIDRMIFIMEEVERLCFMDIEELHKIYVSVLPKIKHNQEVLMNMNFKEMFYKKLEENLDE